MKELHFIGLLLLLQVALSAQKPLVNIIPFGEDIEDSTFSISGTLYDEVNKDPILFANVALYNADSKLVNGVETNLKGEYHLKAIKPGRYFLEASFIGYKTSKTSQILIFDAAISNYDLYLKENKSSNFGCLFYYKAPLIDIANPSYITTFTSSDISNRY